MWLMLAQEAHGHEGSASIDPLNMHEPSHLLAGAWAWALFIVLLIVLRKMAWGPITQGLAAREKRITDSLAKAEEVEKAAREIGETNRKLLEKAQVEAQKIVTDARNAAKSAEAEILAKATAEVEAQRERFTRETQLAIDKAKADLRRETVELTIEATAKLLGRSMSGADDRRLAEQALRDAESVARN